uniref:Uncharacterized protein n=1 Tax=viral metagenome TaxID=1070528 RepID=A0A6C0KS73_9ZZZZ
MNYLVTIAILVGIILGVMWYLFGERFDKKSLSPKCWEILHYHNKERFPLFLVHIKSILAGIILIILAYSKFKYKNEVIAFIGGAIIGLHLIQWKDEHDFIST